MRKLVYLLSAIILFSFVTNTFAQELHLTTFDAKSVEQVKRGDNVRLEKAFDGDRASNPDQTVSKSNKVSKFPIMTPFLLVAKPKGNPTEIVWNINSKNVTVVSAPQGSTFESSSHVRTPVLKQSQTLTIENPVVIKEGVPVLVNGWERNSFNYSSIFEGDLQMRTADKKDLIVSAGSSYIVVLATVEDYVHISAVSYTNGDVDGNASVVGHVQFIPTPYISGGSEFDLTLTGGPVVSPVSCDDDEIQFVLYVENKGRDELDLSQVALQVKPKAVWIEGKGFVSVEWMSIYKNELGSGILKRGETKEILLPKMKVNWPSILKNTANAKVGLLKTIATILYPHEKEGKSVDLDVSFTCEIKTKFLAGIETKITKGVLWIKNTANNEPAGRILTINSITGVANASEDVSAQDWVRFDEPSNSTITVTYTLYEENRKIGPFELIIKK